GMLSKKGLSRAFDAGADGFVRSEGAGAVLLKPLARAIADGDRIYAVIAATAVNEDGKTDGLSMPSGAAQRAMFEAACAKANVDPGRVDYVEAHGTGTRVGDPIEARAIGAVYGAARPAGDPVHIGSVKTNIGHLEAGSGIAGLTKLALSLYHGTWVKSLH